MTVADHGPRYRSLLRQFQAERDGLRGAVYDPSATTETDHSPVAPVAYLQAAQDLSGPDTPPETLAEVELLLERLRDREAVEP